jgi:hypothetical protein
MVFRRRLGSAVVHREQMASQFVYKDKEVPSNSMQFSSLIDFAIQVGRTTARTADEKRFVDWSTGSTNLTKRCFGRADKSMA